MHALCLSAKSQVDRGVKTSAELNEVRLSLEALKAVCADFLTNVLKRVKLEHACFHPDLNVFNKFKANYRQLKEVYLYLEDNLSNMERLFQWSFELIVARREATELVDLIAKLPYLASLLEASKTLVVENLLFKYQSETTHDFEKGIAALNLANAAGK